MKNKRIKVLVAPDGEVTIEAIGFTGIACEKATKALEKALGFVGARRLKPERFEDAKEEVKAKW